MAVNFCPNCGTKTNGANFCPNCGAKISEPVVQSTSTSAQTSPAPSNTGAAAFNNLKNNNQELLKRFGLHGQQAEQPQKPQLPPEPAPIASSVPSEPVKSELPGEPVVIKAVSPSNEISQDDKKKLLNEIVNEPVIPDSSSIDSSKALRIKRPEKKNKARPSIINNFLSAGYADESSPDDEKIKIVQDDIYNKSLNDYIEYEKETDEPEKPQKKKSRSANTTGTSGPKASPALIQKATNVAAKHLIDEDKKLDERHRVYIVEQDEMADPNDPTYDGYYENVIPIDETSRIKEQEQGKKFTINDETKKTLFILLGLFVGLIVVILINF